VFAATLNNTKNACWVYLLDFSFANADKLMTAE